MCVFFFLRSLEYVVLRVSFLEGGIGFVLDGFVFLFGFFIERFVGYGVN